MRHHAPTDAKERLSTMKFPSQLIEFWPLDRPIPNENNPRTHSNGQIKRLARSMQKFGFIWPLLVNKNGNLIAGHARLLAARLLGLQKIPVIVVDYLTETEQRAFMIADNQLAQPVTWNDKKLREALAALAAELFEVEVIGFNQGKLNQLMARLDGELGHTDGDAIPNVGTVTVSASNDSWALGDHRVRCGDATLSTTIEQIMDGERAAMAFTDFPYNVNYQQKTAAGLRIVANDNLGKGFEEFLYAACLNILAATDGAIYLCMSSSELHTLYTAFTRAGGHWSTFVIWSKDQFTLGRSDYQRQFEPILYGWRRGGQHFWCGARDQGDIWEIQKPRVNDLHPTMKPIELIERALRNSSQGGDLVLDPFAGSGSTLIACQRTGRRARLIELEPQYVDVIIRRWQAFTGRSATLEGHGGTFEEVATERLRKAA
jgi:DNA modification methylase